MPQARQALSEHLSLLLALAPLEEGAPSVRRGRTSQPVEAAPLDRPAVAAARSGRQATREGALLVVALPALQVVAYLEVARRVRAPAVVSSVAARPRTQQAPRRGTRVVRSVVVAAEGVSSERSLLRLKPAELLAVDCLVGARPTRIPLSLHLVVASLAEVLMPRTTPLPTAPHPQVV